MVIGFAGRCRSGKTELSRICEEYGYKRLFFALPLKELCADLLDVSMEELTKMKDEGTEISLTLNKDICRILSEMTDIPMSSVLEAAEGVFIRNVRELLQFVGTDIIRKYNQDWHVERLRTMMGDGGNYVLDDVRFLNEARLIQELGGHCWFVTRPKIDNVSNHESETSITWHDCYNKVIINDSSLKELKDKWRSFMSDYDENFETREKLFDELMNNGNFLEVTKESYYEELFISRYFFIYSLRELAKEEVSSIRLSTSNTLFLTKSDGSVEVYDNPLNIEDLKVLI